MSPTNAVNELAAIIGDPHKCIRLVADLTPQARRTLVRECLRHTKVLESWQERDLAQFKRERHHRKP